MNIDYRNNATYTVYIHILPKAISGYDWDKYYVGITKRKPEVRWRNGEGYSKNVYFYRAIQKYGWENFFHDIIAYNLTEDEAKKFEVTLIRELKSNDYHFGYNISSGGEGKSGVPTSQLHKKVTSDRMKECWKDPEYRKKMSNISKHDDEWKKKHSKTIKKKWEDPEYRKAHSGVNASMYGKKGVSLKGANNGNAKAVVCLNTGIEYGCMKDASISAGTSPSNIGECCNGRRKTAGIDDNGIKLLWAFKSDYEKMTTEEILERINIANKKPLMVVNLDTKILYSNVKVAKEHVGANNESSIYNVCLGKNKKSLGFRWQYYNDYLKENNLTDDEARKSLFFIE